MAVVVVPAEFRQIGNPPDNQKSTCKVCNLKYNLHSGDFCAICKDAVEHHTLDKFDACLDGQRRMAQARFLADIELNDLDRSALKMG